MMICYQGSFRNEHRDSPVKRRIHLNVQTPFTPFKQEAKRASVKGLAEGVRVRAKKVKLYIIQKITMNNR